MKLVLLLSVIFIFDTCRARKLVQVNFGCPFDSNYHLQGSDEDTRVPVYMLPTILDDVEEHVYPVWGKLPMDVASFDDEHEFRDFLKALEKIHDEVVHGTPYNTIENLLCFFEDFKEFDKDPHSHYALHLNDFFVQYVEAYKPTDGASLTIKIANRMIAKHPKFAGQILAASLSTCVAGEFDLLNQNQLKGEPHLLPVKNYNDRVMGFIRIRIGTNKTGYVVMDPARALPDIVVLMDSRQNDALISPGITRDPLKDIKYLHLYQKMGDYIDVSSYPKSKRTDSKSTICYVGKPFCSYEKESRMIGLVQPSHSMIVQDNEGNIQGGLFVNLYETDKDRGRIVLWGADKTGGSMVFKFENINQLYQQLKEDQTRQKVYEVGKALGKTQEQMDDLLTRIGIMLDDHVFMFQMERLYGWLSKDTAKHYVVKDTD